MQAEVAEAAQAEACAAAEASARGAAEVREHAEREAAAHAALQQDASAKAARLARLEGPHAPVHHSCVLPPRTRAALQPEYTTAAHRSAACAWLRTRSMRR